MMGRMTTPYELHVTWPWRIYQGPEKHPLLSDVVLNHGILEFFIRYLVRNITISKWSGPKLSPKRTLIYPSSAILIWVLTIPSFGVNFDPRYHGRAEDVVTFNTLINAAAKKAAGFIVDWRLWMSLTLAKAPFLESQVLKMALYGGMSHTHIYI